MSKIDDLIESFDGLAGAVGTQNDLINSLPELTFRVKILWGILCVVGSAALLGFLGWQGNLHINRGGA